MQMEYEETRGYLGESKVWEVGGGFYSELALKTMYLANVTNLDEMIHVLILSSFLFHSISFFLLF